jgi:hypothetical protein
LSICLAACTATANRRRCSFTAFDAGRFDFLGNAARILVFPRCLITNWLPTLPLKAAVSELLLVLAIFVGFNDRMKDNCRFL